MRYFGIVSGTFTFFVVASYTWQLQGEYGWIHFPVWKNRFFHSQNRFTVENDWEVLLIVHTRNLCDLCSLWGCQNVICYQLKQCIASPFRFALCLVHFAASRTSTTVFGTQRYSDIFCENLNILCNKIRRANRIMQVTSGQTHMSFECEWKRLNYFSHKIIFHNLSGVTEMKFIKNLFGTVPNTASTTNSEERHDVAWM